MKWYSVKKYRPAADGYCLVRTLHGSFYSAEWRGGSEDKKNDNSQYSSGWMMDTLCEDLGCPDYIEICAVTHFCIPEPIEIEE